jgi:enoyl-CoA hydratase/carnithine racemase
MRSFTTIAREGTVLVVAIDNPPVNALSPGVPEAIDAALNEAERDPGVRAVVLRGAGRMFVAGADITTLEDAAWGNETAAPDWHDLFERIEDCRRPVVMAIHGAALGGGLELAMAGHYRVATPSTQIGQPEVNLGIIPGAEGTQRLPRLAGVGKALDMCVTGRPISAADALAAGVIDEVSGDDPTAAGVEFARRILDRPFHPKTRDRRDRLGDRHANEPLFARARELATGLRRFQTAPLRAVDAIEAATTLPFDAGWRRERELFLASLRDEQAKALIHLFFAERALKKRHASDPDWTSVVGGRLIRRCELEVSQLVSDGVPASQIQRALMNFGFTRSVAAASPRSSTSRAMADDEIVERCVYAIVDEGAVTLESDATLRAADIDAIMVQQHGFPGWRGGPMFYADRVGLAALTGRVARTHAARGDRWQPAGLVAEAVRTGMTFRERDLARTRKG